MLVMRAGAAHCHHMTAITSAVRVKDPCASAPDPDFFHSTVAAKVRTAQSYCRGCPRRLSCLKEGMSSRQSGVWGGRLLRLGKTVRL